MDINESNPAQLMVVNDYRATELEVFQLRKLSMLWMKDDGFWGFDKLTESLYDRHVKILYVKHTKNEAEISNPYEEGVEDGNWGGFILFRACLGTADLFYIYVRKELRGQGYARLLFEAMLKHMQLLSKEPWNLHLEVKEGNKKAICFYEKMGMQLYRKIPKYYKNGEDALVYILQVSH